MTPQPEVVPDTGQQSELLVVEELMLLLLDDDGASIQAAGTLFYTLGGAVLAELALLGRVEVDDSGSLNGPRVLPIGTGPLPDPLLQSAYDRIAAKPQRLQPLIATIGADLSGVVLQRLADRGILRRHETRFLRVFRSSRWLTADMRHEAKLRVGIRAVLVDGQEPDPRTAVTIGLLYASGGMPSLRPPLPWTTTTVGRAQELANGYWGSEAVSQAVARTTGAIVAASVATVTATR